MRGRALVYRNCRAVGVFTAAVLFFSGGCAVNPLASHSDITHSTRAEHDVLAKAAKAVETAPWPKPENVSFVARITGGDKEDRITRSDAIAIYLDSLTPAGDRFLRLADDAANNLVAADALGKAAHNALSAPRLSKNDVAMLENAIRALRENRQIYVSAARQIEKNGEAVDPTRLAAIGEAYEQAIRDLGDSADALADRIERDRTETVAEPAPIHRRNFSGV